eukprot:UN00962
MKMGINRSIISVEIISDSFSSHVGQTPPQSIALLHLDFGCHHRTF